MEPIVIVGGDEGGDRADADELRLDGNTDSVFLGVAGDNREVSRDKRAHRFP